MKKIIFIGAIILVLIVVVLIMNYQGAKTPVVGINNFEECAAQGFLILESYPRQCKTSDNKTFTEDIGNELEKIDLIKVENPRPNQTIISPLFIKGEAKGFWFFEASFPIRLYDESNKEIALLL